MNQLLIVAIVLLNLCSFVPFHAAANSSDRQSVSSSNTTSKAACSDVFKTSSNRPRYQTSSEDAETVKTYIFQGPIINFYLRNIKNPANSVIAKALFEPNNLDEAKVQTMLQKLDRVLERHAHTQVKQVVYRGEGRPNDGSIYIGARLHYDNYISTTRDKELALGYAKISDSGLRVFYEIIVDRGQPGAQINLLAPEGLRNQDEFLLARNGILIVNEVTTSDGITYVKASYSFGADK